MTGQSPSSEQVVRVEPATIEGLPGLVGLVEELMALQADSIIRPDYRGQGFGALLIDCPTPQNRRDDGLL